MEARADAAKPFRYERVVQQGGGWTIPTLAGEGRWRIRRKAVWSSGKHAVERLGANGAVRAAGLPDADVRAALARKNGLLVVVQEEGRAVLVELAANVNEIARSPLPITSPINQRSIVEIAGEASSGAVFVRLDGRVLICRKQENSWGVNLVEDDVVGMRMLYGTGPWSIGVVHKLGAMAFLSVLDTAFRTRIAPSLPAAESARILAAGSSIVVVTPIGDNTGSQITLVNPATTRSRYVTLDIVPDLVTCAMRDSTLIRAFVHPDGAGYALSIGSLLDPSVSETRTALPPELGRPRLIRRLADVFVIVTDAGMVTADGSGTILSADTLQVPADASAISITGTLERIELVTPRETVVVSRVRQPLWMVVRFVRDALAFVVPLILLVAILFSRRQVARQRTLIEAMMELPGAGMVLLMDASGRLLRVNDAAGRLLRISAQVPMRRLFRTYALHDAAKGLLAFVTQAQSSRAASTDRVSVIESGTPREYVFNAVPLRGGFGRYAGMLITGVDITEELERRRLVNWAQLAHDMQTNLSTIRLNAEQLVPQSSHDGERRRRILFQVGILIQRVRDLVSVGRSDALNKLPVHSAELCTEIRHEFDASVFPHVTFHMKLRGTMMNVDRLKISRAVRNAVENGIKALKGQPGTIEIATWFDRNNVYIRVSDSGAGMDAETLANMMKPFFTTAKDGSGTGIGTMIMQHVMHLHGGSLRVMSSPGHGTQIIFRIPHGMERLRVADELYEDVA
jgi:signal transduction histidine kinase